MGVCISCQPLFRMEKSSGAGTRSVVRRCMRILIVCHRFPFPPNRGGKIRPFQMIRHLGVKHSVVVATLAHTEDELQQGARLSEYCDEVIAEVESNPARWRNALLALPTYQPSSA